MCPAGNKRDFFAGTGQKPPEETVRSPLPTTAIRTLNLPLPYWLLPMTTA